MQLGDWLVYLSTQLGDWLVYLSTQLGVVLLVSGYVGVVLLVRSLCWCWFCVLHHVWLFVGLMHWAVAAFWQLLHIWQCCGLWWELWPLLAFPWVLHMGMPTPD